MPLAIGTGAATAATTAAALAVLLLLLLLMLPLLLRLPLLLPVSSSNAPFRQQRLLTLLFLTRFMNE